MKNSRWVLVLVMLFLTSTTEVHSQQREHGSIEQLKMIAEVYTHQHDVRNKYRKSEYLILFLHVDSAGKVSSINMMSDEENRDSGYYAFKRLTPEALKNWTGNVQYRNKVIVLPVYCMGIEQVPVKESVYDRAPFPPIYLPPGCTAPSQSRYILATDLVYFFPVNSRDE